MNLVPILLLTIFFTSSRFVMSTSCLKNKHKQHITTTQQRRLCPPYLILADGQYVIQGLAECSDDDSWMHLLLKKWLCGGQHLTSCGGERGRGGEREEEGEGEREKEAGRERKKRGRGRERGRERGKERGGERERQRGSEIGRDKEAPHL